MSHSRRGRRTRDRETRRSIEGFNSSNAEHGEYPEGTVDAANQWFDDWAADTASAAIREKCPECGHPMEATGPGGEYHLCPSCYYDSSPADYETDPDFNDSDMTIEEYDMTRAF